MSSFSESLTELLTWLKNTATGMPHVLPYGISGVNKDRIASLTAVTTRRKFTWPAGVGPKAILISTKGGATDVMKVCFDAESDLIATTNLAQAYDTGDSSLDVLHKQFLSTDLIEKRQFFFGAPLERLDFLPVTGHTQIEVQGV